MPKRGLGSSILVIGVATVLFLAACGGDGEEATFTSADTPAGETPKASVALRNYRFEPRRFELKVGESIELTLTSVDDLHTFTVKELDIDWGVPSKETQTQQFTFTEPGEFKLVCTIPTHEALGMTGTIIVQ